MKTIEVLFFSGCPHVELAVARAREAIRLCNMDADIALVEVTGAVDAVARRFFGSPSVRVDGTDVDPSVAHRSDFGLQCRLYAVGGRFDGAPPAEWIAAALEGRALDGLHGSAREKPTCCGG